MKDIEINTKLLFDLQRSGDLRRFAIYIKLKSVFNNSCFYKFSYKRLSVISGISESVLKKNIKAMLSMKWLRLHCGNLIIEKIKRVDGLEKSFVKLTILKNERYINIFKRLNLCLVRGLQKKFEYIKKISSDYNINKCSRVSLDDYKRACAAFRKFMTVAIGENENFSISNFKVGQLINRSKSSASRLMKWGSDNRVLTSKERYYTVSEVRPKKMKDSGLFYSFKSKRWVIQYPNLVNFL